MKPSTLYAKRVPPPPHGRPLVPCPPSFGAACGMAQAERFPRRSSSEWKPGRVSGGLTNAPSGEEIRVGGIRVSGGWGRRGVEAGVDVIEEQGRRHLVQGKLVVVVVVVWVLFYVFPCRFVLISHCCARACGYPTAVIQRWSAVNVVPRYFCAARMVGLAHKGRMRGRVKTLALRTYRTHGILERR